ncbi:MAG TPA: hypothetical protein VD860_17075 [Azospirillum sp.]|nr:hypothetical protein [Azospirillum sp.]
MTTFAEDLAALLAKRGDNYITEFETFMTRVKDEVLNALERQLGYTTSASSHSIGAGSKTFTMATEIAYGVGAEVVVARAAAPATRMFGTVTARSGMDLTVNVTLAEGSGGPYTDWTIQATGARGATGTNTDPNAVAQGKHTIAILAGALSPRNTSGAAAGSTETTTNKVRVATLDFDAATAEYAQVAIPMPKSWDEGTVTAKFFVSTASATGAAVFGLRAVGVSSGDAMDAAFGTGQTASVTVSSAGTLYASAETAAITIAGSPAEGDVVWFEVYRLATDVADTLAADARLHAVHLYYTVIAATDA